MTRARLCHALATLLVVGGGLSAEDKKPDPIDAKKLVGKWKDKVGDEDTAFATRKPPYMVSIDGMWPDAADDDANVAWVRSTWEAVEEHGTGEVYLNFTGRADEAPSAGVDTALGRNMARLAEIKAKYDPDNFFRVNDNIAPAAG